MFYISVDGQGSSSRQMGILATSFSVTIERAASCRAVSGLRRIAHGLGFAGGNVTFVLDACGGDDLGNKKD